MKNSFQLTGGAKYNAYSLVNTYNVATIYVKRLHHVSNSFRGINYATLMLEKYESRHILPIANTNDITNKGNMTVINMVTCIRYAQ